MLQKHKGETQNQKKNCSLDRESLYRKLNKIENLPTLPQIAIAINAMIESGDSSIDEISHVIEKDPAITLKVLRLANSAFYGMQEKVYSISDAIILLGLSNIKHIVTSISVVKAFPNSMDNFSMIDFWRHSVNVAVVSRKLAENLHCNTEKTFLSGLLHDVGKIILYKNFPSYFEKVSARARKERISFFNAERKEISHAEIGAFMADKWNLPAQIGAAIRHHHAPIPNDSCFTTAAIVRISSVISAPEENASKNFPSSETMLSRLSIYNFQDRIDKPIKYEFSEEWCNTVHDEVIESCEILIDKH